MRQPTFLLFRNIHRRGPSDPEYVGSITAGGVNYRIEANVVEPAGSVMKHFAGKVRRTSYAPGRQRQADFDEPLAGASAPEFDDPIP